VEEETGSTVARVAALVGDFLRGWQHDTETNVRHSSTVATDGWWLDGIRRCSNVNRSGKSGEHEDNGGARRRRKWKGLVLRLPCARIRAT
jgi:hypothetical protein